jgi:hypothetical protein
MKNTILKLAGRVIAAVLLVACLAFAERPAQGQLREVGTMTISGGIRWTPHPETNIVEYRIYLATNSVPTNFVHAATVTTNQWPGDATKAIHGQRALYVTAVNNANLESDPGEIVLVTFRAGVPVPVSGIQIYTLLTLAATNALPPAPPMPQ